MKLIKVIAPLAIFACVSTMNAQSAEKLNKRAEKRFSELDLNGNGVLTKKEILKSDKLAQKDKFDSKKSKRKFKSFDKDENKKVSKQEFKKVFLAYLKKKK